MKGFVITGPNTLTGDQDLEIRERGVGGVLYLCDGQAFKKMTLFKNIVKSVYIFSQCVKIHNITSTDISLTKYKISKNKNEK